MSELGRASAPKPRPIVDITADGRATLTRMRMDAERLRDLGDEARIGFNQAIERAEQLAEAMVGQLFETGAKVVREKIEEIEKAIRR